MSKYLLEVFINDKKIYSYTQSADEVWVKEKEGYAIYYFKTNYDNKRKTETYQIPSAYIVTMTTIGGMANRWRDGMTKEKLRETIIQICDEYTQSGFLDLASSLEESFINELIDAILLLEKEKE